MMEHSDTITLGTLVHFRHFRHLHTFILYHRDKQFIRIFQGLNYHL